MDKNDIREQAQEMLIDAFEKADSQPEEIEFDKADEEDFSILEKYRHQLMNKYENNENTNFSYTDKQNACVLSVTQYVIKNFVDSSKLKQFLNKKKNNIGYVGCIDALLNEFIHLFTPYDDFLDYIIMVNGSKDERSFLYGSEPVVVYKEVNDEEVEMSMKLLFAARGELFLLEKELCQENPNISKKAVLKKMEKYVAKQDYYSKVVYRASCSFMKYGMKAGGF